MFEDSFSLCTCWSSSRSLCLCSVPESFLSLERASGTEFERSKKGFVKFIRIPPLRLVIPKARA